MSWEKNYHHITLRLITSNPPESESDIHTRFLQIWREIKGYTLTKIPKFGDFSMFGKSVWLIFLHFFNFRWFNFFKFEEKSKVVPLRKFQNLKIFLCLTSQFDEFSFVFSISECRFLQNWRKIKGSTLTKIQKFEDFSMFGKSVWWIFFHYINFRWSFSSNSKKNQRVYPYKNSKIWRFF